MKLVSKALIAASLAALMFAGQAEASGAGPTPWDKCFTAAGNHYGINPLLLKAIARQESSVNPRAIGNNTNGTQDLGMMQINTTHLRKLARSGIGRAHLMDACTNIAVGAWVLADAVSRHGMSWKAVGVYHSPTPWRQRAYAAKVARHLVREIQAAKGQPVPRLPDAVPMQPSAAPAQSSHHDGRSIVWEAPK